MLRVRCRERRLLKLRIACDADRRTSPRTPRYDRAKDRRFQRRGFQKSARRLMAVRIRIVCTIFCLCFPVAISIATFFTDKYLQVRIYFHSSLTGLSFLHRVHSIAFLV